MDPGPFFRHGPDESANEQLFREGSLLMPVEELLVRAFIRSVAEERARIHRLSPVDATVFDSEKTRTSVVRQAEVAGRLLSTFQGGEHKWTDSIRTSLSYWGSSFIARRCKTLRALAWLAASNMALWARGPRVGSRRNATSPE